MSNPYDKEQQARDIEKYGFLVHPYDDENSHKRGEWTLEQCIHQSKAHRAYLWDTFGTASGITLEWYEQRDKEIAEMELELANRNAFEALKASSDGELLQKVGAFIAALTANDNEFARKLGMGDDEINALRQQLAKFENAVNNEQQSARINDANLNAAADQYLANLDDDGKKGN